MRRGSLAVVTTVSLTVLLFSYRESHHGVGEPAAGLAGARVVTGAAIVRAARTPMPALVAGVAPLPADSGTASGPVSGSRSPATPTPPRTVAAPVTSGRLPRPPTRTSSTPKPAPVRRPTVPTTGRLPTSPASGSTQPTQSTARTAVTSRPSATPPPPTPASTARIPTSPATLTGRPVTHSAASPVPKPPAPRPAPPRPAPPRPAPPRPAPPKPPAPKPAPAPAPKPAPAPPIVVDGGTAQTNYGPVQVEIRIAGGRITSAQAVQYPSGGHSGDISSFAIPQLQSEAVAAQSASIDGVSGATYTSQGFQASLQSALDAAHFGT